MVTAVASQIKRDYPGCHLTWFIGDKYKSVIDHNPHVDAVISLPMSEWKGMNSDFNKINAVLTDVKMQGNYDGIFLTDLTLSGNMANYDGTNRSSMFRGYPNPITKGIQPVMRLVDSEIQTVTKFIARNKITSYKNVILFECSPQSDQSFVNKDFALRTAQEIVYQFPDTCVIMTGANLNFQEEPGIIDAGVLSFRENAQLANYCTLLIGCSSGITQICQSDWVTRKLPMIQLIRKDYHTNASLVQDLEYHGVDASHVIEMTECTPGQVLVCVVCNRTFGFEVARSVYHEPVEVNLAPYFCIMVGWGIRNGRWNGMLKSFGLTFSRFGLNPRIIFGILKYGSKRIFRQRVKGLPS